jgi:hypothetical protein
MKFLAEFWEFLKVRKIWWITPIVIVLLVLGIAIWLAESSAVAPFIYTIF